MSWFVLVIVIALLIFVAILMSRLFRVLGFFSNRGRGSVEESPDSGKIGTADRPDLDGLD